MPIGDYITLQQVQQLTGLSYNKVYRAVKKLGLDTVKAGNTLLVKVSSLEQLKDSK